MHLHELTHLMDQFVRSKGWYEDNSPRPQTPRNIAVSLSIETAEVLEHFQWSEKAANPEQLAGELADVALYLFQLAHLTQTDLEIAILQKLRENYRRTWDQDQVK
jgi:NTP pyrophosphatase (non-canonical NTP hydrolase)